MAAPGPRELLLASFEAALSAVDARRCTRNALSGATYDGDWHVLAIGKAAGAMALGALERLGPRCIDGMVVTAPGHVAAPLAGEARVQAIAARLQLPHYLVREALTRQGVQDRHLFFARVRTLIRMRNRL